MVAVELSAFQSVKLFGWLRQPVLTLSWHDVKTSNFTWRQLRALGLTPEQLKRVQPVVQEWVQRGGIQLTDIPDMTIFPVNPLTDFGVDLSELWTLKCESGTMKSMGIEYQHLLDKGITPQIMAAFNLPLGAWNELGFTEKHASYFTDAEAMQVFGIKRAELCSIIQTFRPPGAA